MEPGDEGSQGTEPVAELEVFVSLESLDDTSLDNLPPLNLALTPAESRGTNNALYSLRLGAK